MTRLRSHGKAKRVESFLGPQSYRNSKRYLIPLVLIAAVSIFAIVLGRLIIPTRDERIHLLRSTLSQQIVDSDLDGASHSLHKLQALSPENQNFAFQRATIEHARGNTDDARKLIQSLIERGNSTAAFWELEQDFKDQNYNNWDDTERARFEKLTTLAASSADSATIKRAKEHLAAYQLHHNQLEKSLDTLHEVTCMDPGSGLSAAVVAMKLGQNDRAREYLVKAQIHFESDLLRNPQDQRARFQLSRTLILQGLEQKALQQLSEGFRLTGSTYYQQAAGEAMVMWASRIKRESTSSETILSRLKLIHRATQCAPSDHAVLKALAEFLNELRQHAEFNATQLQTAMANGFDHESAHFMLGILSVLDSDDKKAQFHCDLAEAAGSHMATVLNNLALLAFESEVLAIDDALLLVNCAIKRLKGQPQFRETRGRIFIALRRYDEAIEDLKEALVVEALKPKIYESLSTAYAAMGNASEAAYYKNFARNQ